MRKFVPGVLAVLSIMVASTTVVSQAADKDDHEAIEHVMKEGHKGGLLKTVVTGQADDAEKKQLLSMYIMLWEAKPPKGELASWRQKTGNMVAAAGKVVLGQDGAEEELKNSANCKACHSAHKP